MITVIALVLTLLTFAFVVYPFFKQRPHSAEQVEDEKLQDLHSQRDTTYAMLKELEFDFQSGVLTEEDYRELESKYRGKAISILQNIDDLGKDRDIDQEIEKQVLALRQSQGQFCTQCGARNREANRFCSQCGASLNRGEQVG